MEECEALCYRLVIMAAGKICCIGSVQYLKGKFGNMYTIKIKLHPAHGEKDRSGDIAKLKQFVITSLVECWLTEEHETMLQFEVAATGQMRLSNVLSQLLECLRVFPYLMEDFALSQVTLERVFVDIAESQKRGQQREQPETKKAIGKPKKRKWAIPKVDDQLSGSGSGESHTALRSKTGESMSGES